MAQKVVPVDFPQHISGTTYSIYVVDSSGTHHMLTQGTYHHLGALGSTPDAVVQSPGNSQNPTSPYADARRATEQLNHQWRGGDSLSLPTLHQEI